SRPARPGPDRRAAPAPAPAGRTSRRRRRDRATPLLPPAARGGALREADPRTGAPSYARPQGVPGDLELTEQVAQHGQTHPDDRVIVALDGADIGPAEPVDGERPRYPQRLAGRDVGLDLVVTQVGEVHERGGRGADGAAGPALFDVPHVDEPVASVEYAGAPPHPLPPADCFGRVGGLAVDLA